MVTQCFFSEPYVELSGQVLADNSLIADTDINSSLSRDLRCVTARMDCCSVADIDAAWYLPNGSTISGTNVLSSGEGFTLGSVALVSSSLVSVNQGIYRCTVPQSDPATNPSTISYYVGIYNHGQGEYIAHNIMHLSTGFKVIIIFSVTCFLKKISPSFFTTHSLKIKCKLGICTVQS